MLKRGVFVLATNGRLLVLRLVRPVRPRAREVDLAIEEFPALVAELVVRDLAVCLDQLVAREPGRADLEDPAHELVVVHIVSLRGCVGHLAPLLVLCSHHRPKCRLILAFSAKKSMVRAPVRPLILV